MSKRSKLLGLFSVCLILLVAAGGFVLLGNNPENISSLKRDVFDSTQYLFPEQSKISLSIDLSLTQGTVFVPIAPAFLVDGEVLGAVSGIIEPEENNVSLLAEGRVK